MFNHLYKILAEIIKHGLLPVELRRFLYFKQWSDKGLYLRHVPQLKGWWVSWRLGEFHIGIVNHLFSTH